MKKVAIIGVGNVGAHIVSAAINKNLAAEFLLVDQNQEFETAQVLDLCDSLLFSHNSRVYSADFKDEKVKNADIFVITAGVNQKPGETRLELVDRNIKVLKSIKKSLGKLKKTAIVILITNPVDILATVASDIFKLPNSQVFGSGTILDTARLRWRLARKFDKNISNVHGYVMGEHGDSEFIAWSTVGCAEEIPQKSREKIEKLVREEAYKIIAGKGSTYFGIGAATAEIISCILNNSEKVLPLSVLLNGEYEISGISLGVPVKLGEKGILEIIKIPLTNEEKEKLQKSAKKLKEVI
jgi:L-lactate dehydrogenase